MTTDSYSHTENEHRSDTASGILRASVFGVSDGLVSNTALVMGVAGGAPNAEAVILAGAAGLLAGAFSMAAGEYVSMVTQRESMEQQLDLEREHITQFPSEEEAHLAMLLEETGLPKETAQSVTRKIHEDTDLAVDFHALLELGIVPRQLGSPVAAAYASFASFVGGAAIPLIPWILLDDALMTSIVASCAGLLLVGSALTRVTKRNPVLGALRQLAFGGGAAVVTFGLGRLIGAAL